MVVCCLHCPLSSLVKSFIPVLFFSLLVLRKEQTVTSAPRSRYRCCYLSPLGAGSQFWKAVSPDSGGSLTSRAGLDSSLPLSLIAIRVCTLSAVPSSSFCLRPCRSGEWFPEPVSRSSFVHFVCWNLYKQDMSGTLPCIPYTQFSGKDGV